MAQSDLEAIRKKVRRLTRSPSESQLTTEDLDEYINTFIESDFAQRIQPMELRKNVAFFTVPLQDRYENIEAVMSGSGVDTTTPSEIKNATVFTDKPMYIAGREAYVTQSREEFYGLYPHDNEVEDTQLRGDGSEDNFTGYIGNVEQRDKIGLLRRHITISAQTSSTESVTAYDDGEGNFIGDVASISDTNTVDYHSGSFDVTFTDAPQEDAEITVAFREVPLERPDTILFFDNAFFVRPVPDKAYRVEFEAVLRPQDLLESGNISDEVPPVSQWWQFIAYGAAKKIFEDRMDMESVALIQPEFDRQERFVLRSSLLQAKKERAATIYASAYDGYGHDNHGSF